MDAMIRRERFRREMAPLVERSKKTLAAIEYAQAQGPYPTEGADELLEEKAKNLRALIEVCENPK